MESIIRFFKNQGLNKKIKKVENIPDISGLVNNTDLGTKTKEVEDKIPNHTNISLGRDLIGRFYCKIKRNRFVKQKGCC